MAGGMDRRGHRSPSLAERTRDPAGRAGAARTSTSPGSTSPGSTSPASTTPETDAPRRHCWVVDAVPSGVRAPGLLVEWRQQGGTWQGRVAYVVGVDGDATLVETWLPASQLQRASD